MKRPSVLRSLRYLLGIVLTVSVFEACSGDDSSEPLGANGPASVDITAIDLGQGNVLEGGSHDLSCDKTIGVALSVQNWMMRPPNACPVLQCGRVRLRLLDANGRELLAQESASLGVALSVPDSIDAGSFTLSAQLVDDAGHPYNAGDGGTSLVEKSFDLTLGTCPSSGTGGAGSAGAPTVAEGGAAGQGTASEGGTAGIGSPPSAAGGAAAGASGAPSNASEGGA